MGSSQNGTLKASGNVLPLDEISTNDDYDDDDDDEDGTLVSMKLQGALLSDGSGSDNSFSYSAYCRGIFKPFTSNEWSLVCSVSNIPSFSSTVVCTATYTLDVNSTKVTKKGDHAKRLPFPLKKA